MLTEHPSDRSEVDLSAVLTRAGGAMATRERERTSGKGEKEGEREREGGSNTKRSC